MNSKPRFYLKKDEWDETDFRLEGEEAHHASRVLRLKPGKQIEVFNGEGEAVVAEITSLNKQVVNLKIQTRIEAKKNEGEIVLFQAVPKGGNMDWIVQKSVELGVSRIIPILTDNTVVKPESVEKKQQKWQRVALEACKQCGQNLLPEILQPRAFSMAIEMLDPQVIYFVAALDDRANQTPQLAKYLQQKWSVDSTRNMGLFIGPEGDFSSVEYDELYGKGVYFLNLGEIVMKVETATFYALSILKYESESRA